MQRVTGEQEVYVGPRPFRTGQKLYGRSRETAELVSLLISQRLVLLHSPSGAGKTSLIQAKLVPAMQKRRFELPLNDAEEEEVPQPVVIRVNREPEADDPEESNRYILSLLLSLESRLPEEQRRPVSELAAFSIDDYLEDAFPAASREAGSNDAEGEGFRPLLLLFDQLEELLTLDPTDPEVKKEFMVQLGKALSNQGRWALFAIREDFLGSFEPYLPYIPTRLSTTYHLDLLKAEAARQAIQEPAEKNGVSFREEVVNALIEDLREVRIQEPGGGFEIKAGPYVEPVHLQVVCQTLWHIKGDATEITEEHLEKLSRGRGTGVDEVLAGYYAQRVTLAAEAGKISERLVRDWFGKQLIGVQQVRRPILVNEALEFGLTPECLDILDKAFLIRRETRSGAQWYELAHDRLMNPVINDNEHWRNEHLSTFQMQAELWNERGQPADLLLTGHSLDEAEQEQNAKTVTSIEREFLQDSLAVRNEGRAKEEAENQSQRLKLLRRRLYWGGCALALLSVAVVIAVIKSGAATYQAHVADREAAKAQAAAKHAEELTLKAEWQAYAGKIARAQTELKRGNMRLAREYLKGCDSRFRGWEYDYLERLYDKDRQTLSGHAASVTGLAFSPDGILLASCSTDKTVRVWDVIERKVLKEFPGNKSWVNGVAFSPDGKFIATGGDDFAVRLFEWRNIEWENKEEENKEVASQIFGRVRLWGEGAYDESKQGHKDAVSCVAFSPDGRWLVSGSDDGTLKVWDFQNEEKPLLRTLDGKGKQITSVSVSSDSRWIASGSKDGHIQIWNAQTGESDLMLSLKGAENLITCLSFSPDGNWIASGGEASEIYLWDVRAGENQEPVKIGWHAAGVTCLAFNGDGSRIVSGGWNGVLREWIWYPEKRKAQESFERSVHTGIVKAVTYRSSQIILPHQQEKHWMIASGGADCLIKLLDSVAPPEVLTLRDHSGLVWSVDFSPDGKTVVSGSEDQRVKLWQKVPIESWDIDLNITLPDALPKEGRNLIAVAESREGLTIRIFDDKGEKVFDELKRLDPSISIPAFERLKEKLTPENPIVVIPEEVKHQVMKSVAASVGYERSHWVPVASLKAHEWAVWSVDFSPDGKKIVSGGKDGRIIIWDANGGEQQTPVIIKAHSAPIPQAVFSPNGQWIASAGTDKKVKLWKTDGGPDQTPVVFSGHTEWVSAVGFSPDGKWLVSSSGDTTIKIWDLSKPGSEAVRTLNGHEEAVHNVTFSGDGKFILSGSDDKTVRLWKADTGEVHMVLRGHTAWVTSVAFSPDGKRIISGSQDNTIKLWDVSTGQNTLTLDEHDDTVWRAVFSPDGKKIVSSSQDWTIKLWE